MKITVNCLREELAVCPSCGSKHIVGIGKESCHCGQCGLQIEVNVVEKVSGGEERVQEPEDDYTQMSLFE